MSLQRVEGMVLQKLLAIALRLTRMWVCATLRCGMNGAEWQLWGRSGDEQNAGLGGVFRDRLLCKGSAEENKS